MDPYALLSLLFLALFVATLWGLATKRLIHRYFLYFSLLFLGSSMLALANSTFAGSFASSASLLAVLLYLSAALGLFTTKGKKEPLAPAKPDKRFTSKKVRTYSDKKPDARKQDAKHQESKNRKAGKE